MEKRMKLIRDFALWLLAVSVLMYIIFENEVIFLGSILIYVLVIIFTEKQKSDWVRNNPHKVRAKIIKENISNDSYVLEYVVNDVTYTKRFVKGNFDNLKEYRGKYLNVGDVIDVYTSIEIPSYVLLSLERTVGDRYLYTVIVVSIVLVILAFMGLFLVS